MGEDPKGNLKGRRGEGRGKSQTDFIKLGELPQWWKKNGNACSGTYQADEGGGGDFDRAAPKQNRDVEEDSKPSSPRKKPSGGVDMGNAGQVLLSGKGGLLQTGRKEGKFEL